MVNWRRANLWWKLIGNEPKAINHFHLDFDPKTLQKKNCNFFFFEFSSINKQKFVAMDEYSNSILSPPSRIWHQMIYIKIHHFVVPFFLRFHFQFICFCVFFFSFSFFWIICLKQSLLQFAPPSQIWHQTSLEFLKETTLSYIIVLYNSSIGSC